MSWDKCKMKHNDPKSMGHNKAIQREQFTDLRAYLKKQKKSKIKILLLHLKEFGGENNKKTKSQI